MLAGPCSLLIKLPFERLAPVGCGHHHQGVSWPDAEVLRRVELPLVLGAYRQQNEVAPVQFEPPDRAGAKALGDLHFLHPQRVVRAQHLVEKAHHLRPDHRGDDAHAAGEIGRNDGVGADFAYLVDVVDLVAARHHARSGLSSLAESVITRFLLSSPVTANTPAACSMPASISALSSLLSAWVHRALGYLSR